MNWFKNPQLLVTGSREFTQKEKTLFKNIKMKVE